MLGTLVGLRRLGWAVAMLMLPFMAVDASVYEYACHEGNYALPGILAAEREAEKRGTKGGKSQ